MLCSDGLSGMVRFDEIREVLRTAAEPIDACKQLTERANQAGGHDNITVIVAQFDGEGLKALSPDTEPLKYRKYTLPEEPADATERNFRRHDIVSSAPPSAGAPHGPGSHAPQGLSSTMVFGASSPLAPGAASPKGNSTPPPQYYEEERIDIPGTHVPAWVVVVLVVGVILILAGTASLFLR
jgi:protein phosphatase